MEAIVAELSNESNPKYAAYEKGIKGEPEVTPRVGDQYQAEIPDLMPAYVSSNSGKKLNAECSSSIGKPIPIMWSKAEKFICDPKAECKQQTGSHGGVILSEKNLRMKKYRFQRPLPGSFDETWEAKERARFLLGLYTIGKDLNAVKKMVGSKNIGDILSFYYGSFRVSKEYKTWAEGRRSTRKRTVRRQNLLSGWRQQELLSRISPHLPDERKAELIEVSRAFRAEEVLLKEYVFALKDAVGVDVLVDAMQIGKGTKDLTRAAMRPPRTNQSVPADSNGLFGKSWSALSSAEIISFLTAGFRLSKTRSSNIFYKAVWPRLLARGWHSEQPKNHLTNSPVFLIPGITSFAGRRLVKGTDYFDSISDMLDKVALEPNILELETEGTKDSVEILGNGKDLGRKEEEPDDFQGNKECLDAKQSSVNGNPDGVKFTIPETSMSNRAESSKVRTKKGPRSTITSYFPYINGTGPSKKLVTAAGKSAETTCCIDLAAEESTVVAETGLGETKFKSKEQLVISQEFPKHRVYIDLNVPAFPPGFEEVIQNRMTAVKNAEMSSGESRTNQQASQISGPRNRELSEKALEATAYGFLESPGKKRNNPESSGSNPRAKFRRVHSSIVHAFESGNGSNDAPNPGET